MASSAPARVLAKPSDKRRSAFDRRPGQYKTCRTPKRHHAPDVRMRFGPLIQPSASPLLAKRGGPRPATDSARNSWHPPADRIQRELARDAARGGSTSARARRAVASRPESRAKSHQPIVERRAVSRRSSSAAESRPRLAGSELRGGSGRMRHPSRDATICRHNRTASSPARARSDCVLRGTRERRMEIPSACARREYRHPGLLRKASAASPSSAPASSPSRTGAIAVASPSYLWAKRGEDLLGEELVQRLGDRSSTADRLGRRDAARPITAASRARGEAGA